MAKGQGLLNAFIFYGSYHANPINQLIHVICVPAIYTTALSFLTRLSIPLAVPVAARGLLRLLGETSTTSVSAALPAALLVAVASFSTNWLAHGTISPPYAHRAAAARPLPPGVVLRESESWNPDNWYDYSLRLSNGKLLTSYWKAPQGVDRGDVAMRIDAHPRP